MSDHIGGIAILDRRVPQVQRLYCFGFRDSQRARFICIPVYEKGTAKPALDNAWEYEVVGNRLSVTPSVRVLSAPDTEIFHNAGAWSVEFREAVSEPFEEVRAANPGIKTSLDD